MHQIPDKGSLIRRRDVIHHIRDTRSNFQVSFCEHAAYYHTADPALQKLLHVAWATKREVAFNTYPNCQLHSVTLLPPRSLARRFFDRLEHLNRMITQPGVTLRRAKRQLAQKANGKTST
jgi:hypothetical protein